MYFVVSKQNDSARVIFLGCVFQYKCLHSLPTLHSVSLTFKLACRVLALVSSRNAMLSHVLYLFALGACLLYV